MTGLVLCGGNSSRMGTDKGMLSDAGITWAQKACTKLESVMPVVAVSVNRQQKEIYTSHFPSNTLIVDHEQLTIGGPLRGLLSAHLLMPEEDIFVFACDLLLMESIVFEELITFQQQSPSSEAFVYRWHEEAEPLCGIYTARGLAKIYAAYNAGALARQSMKHVLELLDTSYSSLPDTWQPYFKNINTRQDLHR